ncbi:MAG: response regulator transcription factor [Clostridia bacterium]|nr:response regulator transcription factor [Clostridia bacterium]
MSNKYRILIVEDDKDISMIEQAYLENSGYDTHIESDGKNIMQLLRTEKFDLILLDVMLPFKNGFELCSEIRKLYSMPVIMVTAKSASFDKVYGFNMGADDYLTKPFDPAELVARVGANIRQFKRVSSREEQSKEIIIGNIRIVKDAKKVFKNGEEIKFPNREFDLLLFLAVNPDIVFTKEHLFEKIWGYDYMSDSATVMVHINRIREKIEDDFKNPQIIETIRGAGYRLNK